MKCLTMVEGRKIEGISVTMWPYPHVVVGTNERRGSGEKWIAVGQRDASIIHNRRPVTVRRNGKNVLQEWGTVTNVGVIQTPKQNYLLVAPKGEDSRVLVQWAFSSGWKGGIEITSRGGKILAHKRFGGECGTHNVTEEVLAILADGEGLVARIYNWHEYTHAWLRYQAGEVSETCGGEEMFEALSGQVEGGLDV